MKTIKTNYMSLLVTLVTLPSVLVLVAPAPVLFAVALSVAVLAEVLIMDQSNENPLYSNENDERTVVHVCDAVAASGYLCAR